MKLYFTRATEKGTILYHGFNAMNSFCSDGIAQLLPGQKPEAFYVEVFSSAVLSPKPTFRLQLADSDSWESTRIPYYVYYCPRARQYFHIYRQDIIKNLGDRLPKAFYASITPMEGRMYHASHIPSLILAKMGLGRDNIRVYNFRFLNTPEENILDAERFTIPKRYSSRFKYPYLYKHKIWA